MTASPVRGNHDRDARMGAIVIKQSHEIACDCEFSRQRSRKTTRMDEKRPRGRETRGMVPQGPEDAAEHGDRGVQRRQVIKSACSELGDWDLCIGGDKSAMNSG